MDKEIKDSGVEWIGEIPNDWDLQLLGLHFEERKVKVSDRDFQALSVTKKGIYPQLKHVAKTNNNDDRKLVEIGDFVINSRSDRKQSCGLSMLQGSVSVINTVLIPNDIEPEYTKYVLDNYGFAEEFFRWGAGIHADLWSTKFSRMKKIILPIPPKHVQKDIGKKLDKEIRYIEDAIAKTQESIDEYKLYRESKIVEMTTKGLNYDVDYKDSNIEWIGQIPMHWEVTIAKHVLKKLSRPRLQNGDTVICSNHGKSKLLGEINTGLVSLTQSDYQGVEIGDLLVHGMDTWHGAIAVSNHQGDCTSVVHVCDTNEDKLYISYYLKMLAIMNVYKVISNGVRQNTSDFRSWKKVGNIELVLPPLNEQIEIGKHLDELSNNIDTLISAKENQIKELEAYKKSLVYEIVTGKKEV